MLRIYFFTILLVNLSLTNLFAEECSIPQALQNKTCSTEFFRAKNIKDLDDYLKNGKYKNGNLLNLEVDFNLNSKEISIATPCEISITSNSRLNSNKDGICLNAKNISVNGLSSLVAEKKADINLYAQNEIKVINSLISTKGNVLLEVNNYDPFNNEVFLAGATIVQAGQLLVNSKSSVIINPLVRLSADKIELNGGNCEINENFKVDRKHDRECKRFFPSFKYTGTCSSNPLPTGLNIKSNVNSSNTQQITFAL
ncbi:MAG: hypothetical protein K2Q18_04415, partial [Bdellovibrionales bacterium]|nr:hypothetical protein [Bdellovibrionales bacterium]